MMSCARFDIFRERHFGIGLRWETHYEFPLLLSLTLPFFSITVGFGRRKRCAG